MLLRSSQLLAPARAFLKGGGVSRTLFSQAPLGNGCWPHSVASPATSPEPGLCHPSCIWEPPLWPCDTPEIPPPRIQDTDIRRPCCSLVTCQEKQRHRFQLVPVLACPVLPHLHMPLSHSKLTSPSMMKMNTGRPGVTIKRQLALLS